MEDQLKELIALMTAQAKRDEAAAEAEAQKAATAEFVTVDAMKAMFAEFAETVKTTIAEQVEAATPARSEGAGRVGEEEAQKAADPIYENPVAYLASKAASELTRDEKEAKAALIRAYAQRNMPK